MDSDENPHSRAQSRVMYGNHGWRMSLSPLSPFGGETRCLRGVALLPGLRLSRSRVTRSAADQSAQDFLARIYANYKGKDAKGVRL